MRDFDACDILFATDGLLLSVLTEDVLAERYGAIVIDEAHERTLGTDVLLGLLSRVVPLRRARYESGQSPVPPLKLVIMSATLALEPLQALFAALRPPPPVVCIEGRQFPVETHWLRVTPEDLRAALDLAVKTVATIHHSLPRGTVLVFVPGKREIAFVAQQLRDLFGEEAMRLVSLHSGMDPAQQRLAFEPPPEGARLVVVATNIAECSLTLPNVRYVIDPGYAREQVRDRLSYALCLAQLFLGRCGVMTAAAASLRPAASRRPALCSARGVRAALWADTCIGSTASRCFTTTCRRTTNHRACGCPSTRSLSRSSAWASPLPTSSRCLRRRRGLRCARRSCGSRGWDCCAARRRPSASRCWALEPRSCRSIRRPRACCWRSEKRQRWLRTRGFAGWQRPCAPCGAWAMSCGLPRRHPSPARTQSGRRCRGFRGRGAARWRRWTHCTPCI